MDPKEAEDIKKRWQEYTEFNSVQSLSHVRFFVTPWTAAHQASLSITNSWQSIWAYSNSCPLSQWYHPTISSSVIPFSSSLQSFPASGSFPRSQFFAPGGQSIRASVSASVLPINIQSCFPLGLISLLSKGLSGFFSSTTVQKHQFLVLSFFDGPTLLSVHGYRKIHSFDYMNLCWQSTGL